ncbi:MAG: hypothetical protein HW389_3793, partial [Bacteroidetes bacterium]|nr:hypothetical protein [Bacteroidota bacterium]
KNAATKRRELIAAEAILNPRESNAQVDRLKTPELKAREAEAWRAFSQPAQPTPTVICSMPAGPN